MVSEKIQNMVRMLPENLILLETDSPVLGITADRNEPANLSKSLHFISNLLEIEPKELEKITEENSKRIFNRLEF